MYIIVTSTNNNAKVWIFADSISHIEGPCSKINYYKIYLKFDAVVIVTEEDFKRVMKWVDALSIPLTI